MTRAAVIFHSVDHVKRRRKKRNETSSAAPINEAGQRTRKINKQKTAQKSRNVEALKLRAVRWQYAEKRKVVLPASTSCSRSIGILKSLVRCSSTACIDTQRCLVNSLSPGKAHELTYTQHVFGWCPRLKAGPEIFVAVQNVHRTVEKGRNVFIRVGGRLCFVWLLRCSGTSRGQVAFCSAACAVPLWHFVTVSEGRFPPRDHEGLRNRAYFGIRCIACVTCTTRMTFKDEVILPWRQMARSRFVG